MIAELSHWLETNRAQICADLAQSLRTAGLSFLQQSDESFVDRLSQGLIDALRADLAAGGSEQLRTTLRTSLTPIGQQALRFHDLRLLATTLRQQLLTSMDGLQLQQNSEQRQLEDWLFQVPLQAALYYIRQSDEVIRRQYSDLEVKAAEQRVLNEQLQALNTQQDDLLAEQRNLLALIEEVSIPIAAIFPHLLVAPLVGRIEHRRAQLLIEQLLDAIVAYEADIVLLDISGVPLFDTYVAQTLLQTAMAARLLGAQIVLVGMSPEIAQTVVQLRLNLEGLVMRGTLQEGVAYALQLRGLQVAAAPAITAR
jgi:anti-anti-sigma regulatory factor